MLFWVGILIGVLFAWSAVKIGFYEMWAILFNIVISVYLAIYLQPAIVDIVPSASGTPYGNALTMLATAIAVFLILYSISYILLTGQFTIPFPKIFDALGSSVLGFLAGFLLWSFASLLLSITPISQNSFVKEIGFDNQFEQTNVSYICRWCNLVNTAVSSKARGFTAEQAINRLLKSAEKVKKKTRVITPKQAITPEQAAASAGPNEPAEPNDVETGITEEVQPDLPPEADIEDI